MGSLALSRLPRVSDCRCECDVDDSASCGVPSLTMLGARSLERGVPPGPNIVKGGTRGERAGEKSRRSVESTAIRKRIERRDDDDDDDEDCSGRAGDPVNSDERPGTVDHSRAIPNTPTETPADWRGWVLPIVNVALYRTASSGARSPDRMDAPRAATLGSAR
jgi:hypothetical protein